MSEPVLLSWSGGKDSAMTLHALEGPGSPGQGTHHVVALLTTLTEADRRVSQHGVPEELIAAQAEALGLAFQPVYLPTEGDRMVPNAVYEEVLEAALRPWAESGVRTVAHGDLFLEDVRSYREANLARLGMRGLFPIWGRGTAELARSFVEAGFRAWLVSVDEEVLDPSFAGRALDAELLRDLPEGVDPSGENGEYHSFVWDGPGFAHPVPVEAGGCSSRGGRTYAALRLVGAPVGEAP
ncbi:MAG: ATP-binding protein [Thermoanaerobaculia bacterium]